MTTGTYTTWDGVPAGILADATGDLLVRRDAGSHTWVRVLDDWHPMRPDDWYTSLEGVVWPLRLVAPLPSPLTDEAVRAAADAAPAPLPPVPGDRVDHWSDVPEGGVALDRVGDVAHRREGRRYWPRVGREWDPERRPDARGVGDFGPYTYIGQAADHDAARRLVEAHEAAPARPAVKVGDAVPPTEEGWRALPAGAVVYMPDRAPEYRFAHVDGGTIVALVPAPVTHERIRAAVGDCAPAASPTTARSAVGGAAEVCRRLRAERLAGLERTLAAAEARWRELEPVWTVTRGGGIRWHRDGESGQVRAAPDVPGADRLAKRESARRIIAERDRRREAALAEYQQLSDLVARTRAPKRGALCINGALVEVPASATAEALAAALQRAGFPASARGSVIHVDVEGAVPAGLHLSGVIP